MTIIKRFSTLDNMMTLSCDFHRVGDIMMAFAIDESGHDAIVHEKISNTEEITKLVDECHAPCLILNAKPIYVRRPQTRKVINLKETQDNKMGKRTSHLA